jgi:hypothetical protein
MAIEDTRPLKADRRPAPSFSQLSGGDLCGDGRDSHSLVFVCSARASGTSGVRRPTLADHGVPGGCYYLEVLVPYLDFPYIIRVSLDHTVPA